MHTSSSTSYTSIHSSSSSLLSLFTLCLFLVTFFSSSVSVVTSQCLNGGVNSTTFSQCSCPSGYTGATCATACPANLGGPLCTGRYLNLTGADLSRNYTVNVVRWTSTAGYGRTFIEFTPPRPAGSPRSFRFYVYGNSTTQSNYVSVYASVHCGMTACTTQGFPNSFNQWPSSSYNSHLSSSGYVSLTTSLVVAQIGQNNRPACGCNGLNVSSPNYNETWYITLENTQATDYTLYVQLQSNTVCLSPSVWDPVAQTCVCAPSSPRSAGICKVNSVPYNAATGRYSPAYYSCCDTCPSAYTVMNSSTYSPGCDTFLQRVPSIAAPVEYQVGIYSNVTFSDVRYYENINFLVPIPQPSRAPFLTGFRLFFNPANALYSNVYMQRFCNASGACNAKLENLISTASKYTIPYNYIGSQFAFDKTTVFNPTDIYQFSAYDIPSSSACACNLTAYQDVNAPPQNEQWLISVYPLTQSVSSEVTLHAELMELCSGHGTPNKGTTGCKCDEWYAGSSCVNSNYAYSFSPCCKHRIHNVTNDITSSSLFYNHTTGFRYSDGSPVDNSRQTISTTPNYNTQILYFATNATASLNGWTYYLNLTQDRYGACWDNSTSRWSTITVYATFVCHNLSSDIQADVSIMTNDINNGALYAEYSLSTLYYSTQQNIPITLPPDTGRSRFGCVSSGTNRLNKETGLIVRLNFAKNQDNTCPYSLAFRKELYCKNNGTYNRYYSSCQCAPGYGGVQCENLCTPGVADGPFCNETAVVLTLGQPYSFRLNNNTRIWFQTNTWNATGNPRAFVVNITDSNADYGYSTPKLFVAGLEHCDTTSCVQAAYPKVGNFWPAHASLAGQQGQINAFETQTAIKTPILTGLYAQTDRSRCGCSLPWNMRALRNYSESWNLVVENWGPSIYDTLSTFPPFAMLTITVSAVDPCNEHGNWTQTNFGFSISGKCTCEAGFKRAESTNSAATDLCGGAQRFDAPCCLPCNDTSSPDFPNLTCSNRTFTATTPTNLTLVRNARQLQQPFSFIKQTTTVLKSEKALFKYTLPRNPSLNPWLVRFRFDLTYPENSLPWYAAAYRTCSSSIQCLSKYPTMLQPTFYYESYPTGTVLPPYDMAVTQGTGQSSMTLWFNPVSYYTKVGQSTVKNQFNDSSLCGCDPAAYGDVNNNFQETFMVALTPLSSNIFNQITTIANFTDLCNSHGTYVKPNINSDVNNLGCVCEFGWYGQACQTQVPGFQVVSTNLGAINPQFTPSPCCVGQYYSVALNSNGVNNDSLVAVSDNSTYYTSSGNVKIFNSLVYGAFQYVSPLVIVYSLPDGAGSKANTYKFLITTNTSAFYVSVLFTCTNETVQMQKCIQAIIDGAQGQNYNGRSYTYTVTWQSKQFCGCATGQTETNIIFRMFTIQPDSPITVQVQSQPYCMNGGTWIPSSSTCQCAARWSGTTCTTYFDGVIYSSAITYPASVDSRQRSVGVVEQKIKPSDMWFIKVPVDPNFAVFHVNISAADKCGLNQNEIIQYELARCALDPNNSTRCDSIFQYAMDQAAITLPTMANTYGSPGSLLDTYQISLGSYNMPILFRNRPTTNSFFEMNLNYSFTVTSQFMSAGVTSRCGNSNTCLSSGSMWIVKLKYLYSTSTPKINCSVRVESYGSNACQTSILQCSDASTCQLNPDRTNRCQCPSGFEGANCYIQTPTPREVYNKDNTTFTSDRGSRFSFFTQVSPSNNKIEFTFSFETYRKSTVLQVGQVYVRARLGNRPPTLITNYSVSESTRIVQMQTNGSVVDFIAWKPDQTPPWNYQTDVYNTSQTFTITFPISPYAIEKSAPLYFDVYHTVPLDASSSISSTSTTGTTVKMAVSVKIQDDIGTTVGFVALGVLGGAGFLCLVYIVYLRCKYGSVTGGLEQSALKKTKVKKRAPAVIPGVPPGHDQFKSVEGSEGQFVVASKPQPYPKEKKSCCAKFLSGVGLLIALVVLLVFELIKVLFNISILHTSVGSYINVVDTSTIRASIRDTLADMKLDQMNDLFTAFSSLFGFLGDFNDNGLSWNCGGALSMLAPVIILIGAIILVIILQKDYLLKFSLTLRGARADMNKFLRKVKIVISALFTTVLLYVLQVSVLVLTQVVSSTWNIKRSCSEDDYTLVYVGRYLCIVFIVVLFYVSVLMFAGMKFISFRALTFGWLSGVKALLQLTFGIWTDFTVRRFSVVERASEFYVDEIHEDNPQEAVMQLQGGSRGLMWTAFPLGIILTKLCEHINHPVVGILGTVPFDLHITTPRWKRALLWFVNQIKLASVFLVVWSGRTDAVILCFGLTALMVILELFLPAHYYREQWEKEHPIVEYVPNVQMTTIHMAPSQQQYQA